MTNADTIRCTYLIESPYPPEQAARFMAAAMSAGTFTAVPGETEALKQRFSARVESVRPLEIAAAPTLPYRDGPLADSKHQRAEVIIAVPLDITGMEWATALAVVLGSVTELRELSGIRLLDIELPPAFAQAHPGPQFGVSGTRRLVNVHDRPIIGSVIKPNVGLLPEQTAALAGALAQAGVDFIKDDEKMTNPPYATVEMRVGAVMPAILDAAERTGKRAMYAFNVSSDDPEQMARAHDVVMKAGGNCIMVNINQVGYAGVTYLRRRASLPIHAHRNGWGMLTRCPLMGMSFNAYNKFWRLVGVDHLHVNGLRNKYWEADESVVNAVRQCLTPLFRPDDVALPVIGSGMWAEQMPDTYRLMQTTDFLYLAGGGIQGHPGGPAAGARSLIQAWEAAVQGVPLNDYAIEHQELRQALEKFSKGK